MQLSVDNLKQLAAEYDSAAAVIKTQKELEQFRVEWLGKNGKVKTLFTGLKEVSVEDKPKLAAELNKLKSKAEGFVKTAADKFSALAIQEKLASEFLDLTLPAELPGVGHVHPIRLVERKITKILSDCGFKKVEGPEIETEYYCFDALNIPKHHPARDMQDTFYTSTGTEQSQHVLRTHTTSILARELERSDLPLKSIYAGRVYRNESEDASHQAMFHQFDLVWIEEGIGLTHLLGLIEHILKQLYGSARKVRFVPKFYPYTEPSIGPQIDCVLCESAGCPACDGAGWVTVAGAGVVHENVLKEFKLDPEKIGGFAFGLGTSRLAGQFYNSPNLKTLYDADLRYLSKL